MDFKYLTSVLIILTISINCSLSQTIPEITGSKVTKEEAQIALDFHNKVRKEVGAPPLQWSAELAAYAQEWALFLAENYGCKMEHRANLGKNDKDFGENIFYGKKTMSFYRIIDAAESWYNEIEFYNYEPISVDNFHSVGHYTQMVWSSTKYVGIGRAYCKGGALIVVANYDPPGNYLGKTPY